MPERGRSTRSTPDPPTPELTITELSQKMDQLLSVCTETKKDLKETREEIKDQGNNIKEVKEMALNNEQAIKELREEIQRIKQAPPQSIMQAIKAEVHNQSMGPSFQAQIQAVAH